MTQPAFRQEVWLINGSKDLGARADGGHDGWNSQYLSRGNWGNRAIYMVVSAHVQQRFFQHCHSRRHRLSGFVLHSRHFLATSMVVRPTAARKKHGRGQTDDLAAEICLRNSTTIYPFRAKRDSSRNTSVCHFLHALSAAVLERISNFHTVPQELCSGKESSQLCHAITPSQLPVKASKIKIMASFFPSHKGSSQPFCPRRSSIRGDPTTLETPVVTGQQRGACPSGAEAMQPLHPPPRHHVRGAPAPLGHAPRSTTATVPGRGAALLLPAPAPAKQSQGGRQTMQASSREKKGLQDKTDLGYTIMRLAHMTPLPLPRIKRLLASGPPGPPASAAAAPSVRPAAWPARPAPPPPRPPPQSPRSCPRMQPLFSSSWPPRSPAAPPAGTSSGLRTGSSPTEKESGQGVVHDENYKRRGNKGRGRGLR